jgi:hypothetical protein
LARPPVKSWGTRRGLGFEPVFLSDEDDWLYRPVKYGMCKYESLIDGTLDLVDIAIMNEVLDVYQENERRAYESARSKD